MIGTGSLLLGPGALEPLKSEARGSSGKGPLNSGTYLITSDASRTFPAAA